MTVYSTTMPKHVIPEIEMPKDQLDAIIRLVKDSQRATCYYIVNPDYWRDEWTECPLCGCTPDADGVWVHRQEQ
jgi:hypothetical protein